MWPLSISPMEQRSAQLMQRDSKDEEPQSASKLEYRPKHPDQNYNAFSNIEFKKKKLL